MCNKNGENSIMVRRFLCVPLSLPVVAKLARSALSACSARSADLSPSCAFPFGSLSLAPTVLSARRLRYRCFVVFVLFLPRCNIIEFAK